MVTGVPLGPFNMDETSFTVARSVLVSLTDVITSPGRSPARNAGEPSKGYITSTFLSGDPTYIPTP
jgi:hypothetical protein